MKPSFGLWRFDGIDVEGDEVSARSDCREEACRVTAVTDGVAALRPDLQQACFAIWRRKFARLRTTEEVVAELAAW